MNNKDWRITNQENYLKRATLKHSKYEQNSAKWDHDHCAFCDEVFSMYGKDLNEGYCTQDKYYWICEDCFHDFKDDFMWSVVE